MARLSSWSEFFDPKSIERGIAYADDGAVERVLADGDRIIATVQGHQRYSVQINAVDLQRDSERGLLVNDVEAVCSCPVELHCKHAAAAFIALARQLGLPDGLDDDVGEDLPLPPVRPQTQTMPSLPVAQPVVAWLC